MFWIKVASGCGLAVTIFALSMVARGDGDGGFRMPIVGSTGDYTISGTVIGLPSGGTLALSNNGIEVLTVQADGAFSFPTKLTKGRRFEVTARTNLSYLSCVVGNGTGRAHADVDNVVVNCLPWQVSTLAGDGRAGYQDQSGTSAEFNFPEGIAVDGNGNVYVGDTFNHVIRKITPAGVVSTLAGVAGVVGAQDGACGQAGFASPVGLGLDQAGNIFVADFSNNAIRQIRLNTNLPDGTQGCLVKTVAGNSATSEGAFVSSRWGGTFSGPVSVALDSASNLYVADGANSRIEKITPDGAVRTLAGNGKLGNVDGMGGANGPAQFSHPTGVAVDLAGNVYVADQGNNAIRVITPAGVVSTLAGSRQAGYRDGAAERALFNAPLGVAVDAKGVVYVADGFNNAVRMITPAGAVSTVAGSGSPSTDGHVDGESTRALFSMPVAIAVDGAGNLYVAEHGAGSYIRKISPPQVRWFPPNKAVSALFQLS